MHGSYNVEIGYEDEGNNFVLVDTLRAGNAVEIEYFLAGINKILSKIKLIAFK